jgi:hypothetical protein
MGGVPLTYLLQRWRWVGFLRNYVPSPPLGLSYTHQLLSILLTGVSYEVCPFVRDDTRDSCPVTCGEARANVSPGRQVARAWHQECHSDGRTCVPAVLH